MEVEEERQQRRTCFAMRLQAGFRDEGFGETVLNMREDDQKFSIKFAELKLID